MNKQLSRRGLWRVFGAALLAAGTYLAVPAKPAYAIPPCDGEVGTACGTDKICAGVPLTDIKVCLTRYYYWELEEAY